MDKIIDSQTELFKAWEGFNTIAAETLLDDVTGDVLFNVTKDGSKEKAHEGLCACIKAWASWFFNAVIKLITCKCKEIEARPACCWTKLDTTKVEFTIANRNDQGGLQGLPVDRIVLAALRSIGVEKPGEAPKAEESKKGEKAKEAAKSPFKTNMKALEEVVKKDKVELQDVSLARFSFKVINGDRKEGKITFLLSGNGFDDKKAKTFTFAVKA